MKLPKYCNICGKKLKVKELIVDGEYNCHTGEYINRFNKHTGKEKKYMIVKVKCPKASIFNGHFEEKYESKNGGKKWGEVYEYND